MSWLGETASWAGGKIADGASYAGGKIADGAEWVKDTAVDAAEWTAETASDVADTASEAWDVATNTSISYSQGVIGVETDLDEVMDLLPASLAATLQLDEKAAKNLAKVSFDTKTNILVVTTDAVELQGINSKTLKTGAVSIQNLRVTVANHGGGLPFIDSVLPDWIMEEKADNPSATVSIGSGTARDVVYTGPDGPISVASVALEGLNGNVAMTGAQLEELTSTVSIEHAVLSGLKAAGVSVETAQISGLEAGVDAKDETGYLQTDLIALHGAQKGDKSLGYGEVQGARFDVENKGGGLPFIDQTPDQIKARSSIQAMGIHDFDSPEVDIEQAGLKNMTGAVDVNGQALKVGIGSGTVTGVDTSWVDVDKADLSGAEFNGQMHSKSGHNLDLDVDKASADGVRYDPTGARTKSGAPAITTPINWSGSVGDLTVNDIGVPDATADQAHLMGAGVSGRVSGSDSWFKANADRATATNIDHSHMALGGLDAQKASLSVKKDVATLGAQSAALTDVGTENFTAKSIAGTGVEAQLVGDKSTATLDQAQVRDATIAGRLGISEVDVNKLKASQQGDAAQLGYANGEARGMTDTSGATLDSLRTQKTDMTIGGDGSFGAAVTSADATNLVAGDGSFDTADVSGLAVQSGQGVLSMDAQSLGVAGGAYQGAVTADNARATGVSTVAKDGNWNVDASTVGGQNITAADRVTASSLAASGYRGNFSEKGGDMSLDTAQLTGVADAQSRTSVDSAQLGRVRYGFSEQNNTAGVGSLAASNVVVGDNSAQSVNASGATYQSDGKKQSGGVDQLTANALAIGRGTTMNRATVSHVMASQTQAGMTAGVGRANVTNLAHNQDGVVANADSITATGGTLSTDEKQTRLSLGNLSVDHASATMAASDGKGQSTGPELDVARLVETGAARIGSATAKGSAPMRAGKLQGGLDVKQGTVANGQVAIENNRLVGGQTGVDFSKKIDGPVWTSLKGAELTKKDKLKAQVGGWFDQNVTGDMNKALGLEGKKMHDLATIGGGVADQMRKPADPNVDPAQNPFDLSRHELEAQAKLTGGTISAGQAGQVTLANGGRGQNVVNVNSSGQRGLTATVDQLAATGAEVDTGSAQAQLGRTTASGAQVKLAPDGTTTASTKKLDANNIQVVMPKKKDGKKITPAP